MNSAHPPPRIMEMDPSQRAYLYHRGPVRGVRCPPDREAAPPSLLALSTDLVCNGAAIVDFVSNAFQKDEMGKNVHIILTGQKNLGTLGETIIIQHQGHDFHLRHLSHREEAGYSHLATMTAIQYAGILSGCMREQFEIVGTFKYGNSSSHGIVGGHFVTSSMGLQDISVETLQESIIHPQVTSALHFE